MRSLISSRSACNLNPETEVCAGSSYTAALSDSSASIVILLCIALSWEPSFAIHVLSCLLIRPVLRLILIRRRHCAGPPCHARHTLHTLALLHQ